MNKSAKEPWLEEYIKDKQWHTLLEIGSKHARHTSLLAQHCDQLTVLEPNLNAPIWSTPWSAVTVSEDLFDHLTPFRHYDCVVCLGVIPHLHSPFRALDQIARATAHIIIDYPIVNTGSAMVNWQRRDSSDLVNCTLSLPGSMIQHYLSQLGYTCAHTHSAVDWTLNCTLLHRGEVWQKKP